MHRRLAVAITAAALAAPSPATGQGIGEMQTIQGWNVRYPIPEGWSLVRAEGRVRVFQNPAGTATLFAAPGVSATPAEIQNDLIALGSALGLQGQPTTDLHPTSVSGRSAIVGEYDLFSPSTGQRALGRSVTVLSEHGTSLGMVLLAQSDQFASLKAELDHLVGAVRIEAPTTNQAAVAALAGRWTYYSGSSSPSIANSGSYARSYEETVSFDGRGSFEFTSSSYVGASSSRSSEGSYSTASSLGGGDARGTYTVIGNAIVVTSEQGRAVYDYTLQGGGLIAGGKTYIRGN
ncbi:MAG: hypothetical protein R3E10_10200 [Gemmatimonadota bacterium]